MTSNPFDENGKFEFGNPNHEHVPVNPTPDNIARVIGDPKAWEQYHNNWLYEAEKALRNWIEIMCSNKKWVRTQKMRRYTFKQAWSQVFGTSWDETDQSQGKQRLWIELLSHYSSRIQKSYWDKEAQKQRQRTAYFISPTRLHSDDVAPYSLKLRAEWLGERGKIPTIRNMKLTKRTLTPGHARNPKTDANMARRREIGKKIYNEKYKDRKPGSYYKKLKEQRELEEQSDNGREVDGTLSDKDNGRDSSIEGESN